MIGGAIALLIANAISLPHASAQTSDDSTRSPSAINAPEAVSVRAYLPVAIGAVASVNNPNPPNPSVGGELGMDPTLFNQMKQDAAAGMYDRPCGPSEHDPNKWHALVDQVKKCHYNHHHGDDPSLVSDIFGQTGEWFGEPGRSVSYPWQTFSISDNETNPNVDKPANVLWENEYKHEGYIWLVRRNQMCDGGKNCLTDFRMQVHFMSSHDAAVRFHSFSAELRVCADGAKKTGCGIIRTGGWMDYDKLFIPPSITDQCWNVFNGAHDGTTPEYLQYVIQQPNWNQLYPVDGLPGTDPSPFDEFRCHKKITAAEVQANPNGMVDAAEWWGHLPDVRFRILVWNPHSSVGTDAKAMTPFCSPTDVRCRWTFSKFTVEFDYVVPVHESLDKNGDGIADTRGFENRVHTNVRPPNCTRATDKCVPVEYVGMRVGAYNHDLTKNSTPFDYDITPAGRPSWIQWFQPGNSMAHLIPAQEQTAQSQPAQPATQP
jgi:hypothetical protein